MAYRRVALRGPLFSGKTTVATELAAGHGFVIINFTDSLKSMAAHALCELGIPTSLTDIKADKERYRGFLQHLGTLVGFDEGRTVPELVANYLEDYAGEADLVFDNVRFLAQWEQLKPLGFTLVKLDLSPLEQEARAQALGLSPSQLGAAMRHPAEMGFPTQEDEVVLDATLPPHVLAEKVAELPDATQIFRRFAQGDAA